MRWTEWPSGTEATFQDGTTLNENPRPRRNDGSTILWWTLHALGPVLSEVSYGRLVMTEQSFKSLNGVTAHGAVLSADG